jgi:hypothetical protein
MVDLGQKGWKKFHLFYFLKRVKNIDHRKKIADLRAQKIEEN